MAAPVLTGRSDGRSEGRILKRLAAELARPGKSVSREMTFTLLAPPPHSSNPLDLAAKKRLQGPSAH